MKIERYTLLKDGYYPLKIRKILGVWEMLAHTYSNGDERWSTIDLPEEFILKNIEEYGKR